MVAKKTINLPGFSIPACFCISIFFFSCAQVVAPGGGPMDKTPPRTVKYIPDSAQRFFNSREITVLFDEYIQLKDLSTQLIISPPFQKSPDISVKGKTLSIVLDKEEVLKPNTTYSINFGNALQDMNENNPYENFRYLFSTGSYIDSLSIEGKVRNAFDQKTEKGLLVMLYSDMSDSMAYKGPPDYFTRTDAGGSFKISNIRKASYVLVAIQDLNGNYRYDGSTESIGFFKDTVFPGLKQQILVELFKEPEEKIQLKKFMHDQYGKIMLVFNRGTDSLRVMPLNNDQKGVQEFRFFSEKKDTLTYWIKNFEKDTLKLQVSNGNTILDTVEFKMIRREEALKSKRRPLKLSVLKSPDGNQAFDLNGKVSLLLSQPLTDAYGFATAKAILKEDTVSTEALLLLQGNTISIAEFTDTALAEDPEDPSHLVPAPILDAREHWKEKTAYQLFIPPGSLTDIFGLVNDSIHVKFKTKEEKFYGSLKLNLQVYPSERFILQLLNENGTLVRENIITGSTVIEYKYLYPQKYKLKIIDDYNTDGEWTPGNYLKRELPEKVIYNSEMIMIRSNWDAELDWKISE